MMDDAVAGLGFEDNEGVPVAFGLDIGQWLKGASIPIVARETLRLIALPPTMGTN